MMIVVSPWIVIQFNRTEKSSEIQTEVQDREMVRLYKAKLDQECMEEEEDNT